VTVSASELNGSSGGHFDPGKFRTCTPPFCQAFIVLGTHCLLRRGVQRTRRRVTTS
jgi:hypothetical protein